MNARSTPQNHSGEHGGADGGYHGGDYWRRWWISRWRLLEKMVDITVETTREDDGKEVHTLGISPSKLLLTPKSTPLPLNSPLRAPTQPSKHSSPLIVTLDPIELIFSTPPTSHHAFFDSLEDLPPRTINPPPPRQSFESIKLLANQPSPLSAMEPPLPPLPPQLPPLGPNNPFPMLTHEMFCDYCQHTQIIVDNLRDETQFILNHILDRLNVLAHNY
ncbi:hypothetical protein Tco_0017692 [Tanacetum coccineum]